jgi:hypothetical protein
MARMATVAVLAGALSLAVAMDAGAAPDTTPPDPPVLAGTNPASPANRNNIRVLGTAEAGSTVSVYPDGDCSGPPYPSGSASSFASPGIQVDVPDDSTTMLSATATDASSNVSPCSAPIGFVEDSRPPGTVIGRLHLNRSKGTITPVFSSDEPHSTFECHWTRWMRCIPGQRTWHVRPAPRRRRYFSVRAHDAAGNVDPTPAVKPVTYNPVV